MYTRGFDSGKVKHYIKNTWSEHIPQTQLEDASPTCGSAIIPPKAWWFTDPLPEGHLYIGDDLPIGSGLHPAVGYLMLL